MRQLEPTQEWLLDHDPIDTTLDNTWRHGCYVSDIFKREEDSTYWRVDYRLSADGETHGLRENEYFLVEVHPRVVEHTVYEVRS